MAAGADVTAYNFSRENLDGLDDRTGTPLAGSSYPANLSRVWAEVLVRLHGPSSTGGNWK